MPLSASEASIEAEIKTKGLNAPRLTPALIDAQIVGEEYYVFPGTTMTVCALKLRNGFLVDDATISAMLRVFADRIDRKYSDQKAAA